MTGGLWSSLATYVSDDLSTVLVALLFVRETKWCDIILRITSLITIY